MGDIPCKQAPPSQGKPIREIAGAAFGLGIGNVPPTFVTSSRGTRFEHCVAVYFLPLPWIQTGHVPANFDASIVIFPLCEIFHNLAPVRLGNIVGGAGFVGAFYWTIYTAPVGAS